MAPDTVPETVVTVCVPRSCVNTDSIESGHPAHPYSPGMSRPGAGSISTVGTLQAPHAPPSHC